MTLLIIYWIASTILGVYYLIKNPGKFESKDEFTLADVLGSILPSIIIAPFILPLWLLSLIKFKRPKK
jgi:hypothetical protein